MKILLISPVVSKTKRTVKELMMPQLALYILEGLTPESHEVRIIEEEVQAIDFEEHCDLVGISCMTANAPRAYEVAAGFRKHGRTVVLGGVHPTIVPDEALLHADSVVIGEGEGVWEKLLEDFAAGKLNKRYHDPTPDLSRYVKKDFTKIIKKRLFSIVPIMTTRGCPYNCDFCCVTDLFGKAIRHIPVENVVKDIQFSGSRNFMFLDDNIIGHPKYAKELFRALIPLKIKWVGQASISFLKETELLQLAADSGCKILFIGLESVSEVHLKTMKKSMKDNEELKQTIKKIKKMGILIHASMIFGFDSDTKKVFRETVKFLIKAKISTVSFNILTPYPGTKTHETLKKAGRLLTDNWKYYDHNTVVFNPLNMTPLELQIGKIMARTKFYRKLSFLMRLLGNLKSPILFTATNYGHMKQTRIERRRFAGLKSELFDHYQFQ
ncbi:MAG: B12-binding domain-containing radical SAM protein [Bacteroidetes bacterium]|nr:B12-binding domain-containing radical SAM protein [Bacteroidota bacterium]